MNPPLYTYDSQLLIIEDPELGLMHHEIWDGTQERVRILYPNGNIKQETYYKNHLLHGPSIFFSPTGQKLSISWFLSGLQEGLSLYYSLNGSLFARLRFRRGKRHGLQEYFHEDGSLKTEIVYKQGRLKSYKLPS